MRFLEDGHGQILYRIRSLIREQPKILRPFCPQLPRLAQQAAARIRILLTSAAVDTSKARDRGDSLRQYGCRKPCCKNTIVFNDSSLF